MSTPEQLDGPFEDILATPPDLDAIALELRDLAGLEWTSADGTAHLDVLLHATALVRTTAPELLERVRLLSRSPTADCSTLTAAPAPTASKDPTSATLTAASAKSSAHHDYDHPRRY